MLTSLEIKRGSNFECSFSFFSPPFSLQTFLIFQAPLGEIFSFLSWLFWMQPSSLQQDIASIEPMSLEVLWWHKCLDGRSIELEVEQCHSCSAHSFPLYGVVNQSKFLTFSVLAIKRTWTNLTMCSLHCFLKYVWLNLVSWLQNHMVAVTVHCYTHPDEPPLQYCRGTRPTHLYGTATVALSISIGAGSGTVVSYWAVTEILGAAKPAATKWSVVVSCDWPSSLIT